MRIQAIALLAVVLATPPVAYAVDPDRGGGATIPPSGGATAPDPTAPDPAQPTAPPLVPLERAPEPTGGAGVQPSPTDGPRARAAQGDQDYAEVQVPMPESQPAADDGSGTASVADSGLAETGLGLSLILAAGLSMLGAGLLVAGLVRHPR